MFLIGQCSALLDDVELLNQVHSHEEVLFFHAGLKSEVLVTSSGYLLKHAGMLF